MVPSGSKEILGMKKLVSLGTIENGIVNHHFICGPHHRPDYHPCYVHPFSSHNFQCKKKVHCCRLLQLFKTKRYMGNHNCRFVCHLSYHLWSLFFNPPLIFSFSSKIKKEKQPSIKKMNWDFLPQNNLEEGRQNWISLLKISFKKKDDVEVFFSKLTWNKVMLIFFSQNELEEEGIVLFSREENQAIRIGEKHYFSVNLCFEVERH